MNMDDANDTDLDSLSPNPRAITIASIAKPIANSEYLPNLEIVKPLPVNRRFSELPATGNAAGVQPEPPHSNLFG